MQMIGAVEAKNHFSTLLEQVEKGEQVVITKHGKPVAQLISITQVQQAKKIKAISQIKEFAKRHTLDGLNWKALRDEGRR